MFFRDFGEGEMGYKHNGYNKIDGTEAGKRVSGVREKKRAFFG